MFAFVKVKPDESWGMKGKLFSIRFLSSVELLLPARASDIRTLKKRKKFGGNKSCYSATPGSLFSSAFSHHDENFRVTLAKCSVCCCLRLVLGQMRKYVSRLGARQYTHTHTLDGDDDDTKFSGLDAAAAAFLIAVNEPSHANNKPPKFFHLWELNVDYPHRRVSGARLNIT
jgi:hypothetical protein